LPSDLRDQLQATLGGTYSIERELGGGGMSRVFVAEETRLRRKVVVKVLSPELAQGLSAERFEREIQMAASLQQANIVPVLSVGDTNGLPYYTMPFVEGESLRKRLGNSGPPSISEVTRILGDVARALNYAHAHGIVHRDIKPDNVLLSGGTAVVTDFGIAKAISASRTESGGATLTQLGTSIGTPAYMSPEQAAGDPDIDHRADIYAFGCMAYELLGGRPPFPAKTPQRILAAHMGETPQPIAELRADTPAALAALVMQCLEKDAGARPQSAADLVQVLNTVTSGGGLHSMPPVLIGGAGMFRRALALYVGAFAGVAVVAKAAIIAIGLPDWVFPGALIVMALGLPVVLFTGYVQRATHRALTVTPARTPGGGAKPQGTMATIAVKASPHVSWGRTARWGGYALGTFVVLVGGFMLLRSLGIGPAGSLLASGKLTERERILLTDFRITNTDSALGRVASDALRQGLSESSAIVLTSPTTVASALGRMQRPATTRLDLPLARELAQREGIKAIIDGEVAGVADGYIVTVRIITADSGTQLALVTATGNGSQGLIDAVDKAGRALRSKVGESLRRVQRTTRLSQVTTGSLEALRKYSEAFRANAMQGDFMNASALAREAVRFDSNFAMAWRILGITMNSAGMARSAIDSAFERAYQLRDRTSERERLWITGNYFGNTRHLDRTRSMEAWQTLLAIGTPEDSDAVYNYLGSHLNSRREFARADSTFATGVRIGATQMFNYTNRLIALVNRGQLDEARQASSLALSRFPTSLAARTRHYELGYHADDLAKLRRGADSAQGTPSAAARSWGSYRTAELALRGGRRSEWLRFFARGRAVDSARGLPRTPAADSALVGYVDVAVADSSARAVRRLDATLARIPLRSIAADVDRPYFDVADAYAMAGRADKAKAVLAAYAAEVSDTALQRFNQPRFHTALGEIALAEGRHGDALSEFRRGDSLPDGPVNPCTICLPFNLARVFDKARQPDSAVAMYELYVTTPYYQRFLTKQDGASLARVHKRLGELYEAKGDRAKAAANYRKFVDLWTNADPDLQSEVAEIRRRITRLADTERR